jgi:hypothetical protein
MSVQPAAPVKAPEKRSIPGLRWMIFGAIFLILGLFAGGGLALSLLNRQTPTQAVSQSQETVQVTQPAGENEASTLDATKTIPTAPPTVLVAGDMPSATETPRPTATAAMAASPTQTLPPSLTPTPLRYDLTVDEDYANIRTGPGTVYNIIQSLPRGTALKAIGRNAAGDWLVVELEDGKIGWISTKVILYRFDTNLLPAVPAPPTPIVPTKKPTESSSDGSSGQPSNPPTWTPPPP